MKKLILPIALIILSCSPEDSCEPTPKLTTSEAEDITDVSATISGTITPPTCDDTVISQGFVYGEENLPTVDDTKIVKSGSSISASLTNLNQNTTYYIRTFFENLTGVFYGNGVMFSTNMGDAIIQTSAVDYITATSALVAADIISNGGGTIISKGFYFSTETNPTANDQKVDGDYEGSGRFVASIQNLNHNTRYYVKAYAENESGIFYGNEVIFNTDYVGDAIIQTSRVDYITATSALVVADIISDGGGTIISKGFYFSTETNPTVNDQKVDGHYEGSSRFLASIQNLNPNTRYYVKAYAENESGIFYGEERTFKTD